MRVVNRDLKLITSFFYYAEQRSAALHGAQWGTVL